MREELLKLKKKILKQAEIDEHCKGVLEYLDFIKGEEE